MTQLEKVAALLPTGMTRTQIAEEIGCSRAVVNACVARLRGYISPKEVMRREGMAEREGARRTKMSETPGQIPLTRGMVAFIDPEDLPLVIDYSWNAHLGTSGRYYAIASGGIKMHRLILGVSNGVEVDHMDRDGLNNRRNNLRAATRQQNSWNSRRPNERSGFIGVWPNGPGWTAMIVIDGRRKYLGQFKTPDEAARAYDAAARETRGEWAQLNWMHSGSEAEHHQRAEAEYAAGKPR